MKTGVIEVAGNWRTKSQAHSISNVYLHDNDLSRVNAPAHLSAQIRITNYETSKRKVCFVDQIVSDTVGNFKNVGS